MLNKTYSSLHCCERAILNVETRLDEAVVNLRSNRYYDCSFSSRLSFTNYNFLVSMMLCIIIYDRK